MKFRVEVLLDTDWLIDEQSIEEIKWVKEQILIAEDLTIHSNEIGDTVGKIVSLKTEEIYCTSEQGESLQDCMAHNNPDCTGCKFNKIC